MGSCRYQYNPSEQYQNRVHGGGTETHCGGETFHLEDQPEMLPVTVRDNDGNVTTVYQHTGQYLPREDPDPYCPRHGGTPEPPPRVLTWQELKEGAERLEMERRQYVAQLEAAGVEVPDALKVQAAAEPAELEAPPVEDKPKPPVRRQQPRRKTRSR